MDAATQRALIARIAAHRADGRGTDTAADVMRAPVAGYTDPTRFAIEREVIHREPALVGLSGLVPEARTHAVVQVGDRSVIVTRDEAGVVHALLNVCRHRGAEVASGCGSGGRLTCPYHGWSYGLDGSSASRRRGEHFDGDGDALTRLPVLERDGAIWVCTDPTGSLPEQPFQGAERELIPLNLGSLRLFGVREFTRPINWKLAVDTFCEAYHLATLHRTTLAPMIHDDFALFDAFGDHGRLVAARKSIAQLDALPADEQHLLPHATILWFVVPNTVLLHQQDHIQLYQSRPGRTADEAHLTVSLYVPTDGLRTDDYWQKHFDLLVDVTDEEDFTTAAGIQRGYHSPAQDHVVFGRNEPALQHFHRAVDRLVDRS